MGVISLLVVTVVVYNKFVISSSPSQTVQKVYSWSSFQFADLPQSPYANAGGHKYYRSLNVLATSISHHTPTGCFFISIPRRQPGIPATITFFNSEKYSKYPLLRGFPTYEDNYVPGWFGVNDLTEDDYENNIYPDTYRVKRGFRDWDTEYDVQAEGRRKRPKPQYGNEYYKPVTSYHHKPSHNYGYHYGHGHHGGSYTVVYQPQPTSRPTPPSTTKYTTRPMVQTTPKPTYKPIKPPIATTPKPTFKPNYPNYPTYKPTKPPTTSLRPTYKPPNLPAKPPRRSSYHFISIFFNYLVSQCSRLFFIDTGTLQYPEGNIVIRRPVLWAFDINGCDERTLDQEPALKVSIPDSIVNDATGLYDVAVDIYGSCNQFSVYIVNSKDNRLIVYDSEKRSFWFFKHETFYPGAERKYLFDFIPPPGQFSLGILGITLGSKTRYSRDVFYAPGTSFGLFKTNTEILRDESLAPGDPSSTNFAYIGYRGPEQQCMMVFDKKSEVIFFVHLLTNKLACWNTNTRLIEDNVVTLFSDLQFGSDVFLDDERNLWIFLAEIEFELLDTQEYNPVVQSYTYNLYRSQVDNIIRGTACDYL